MPDETKLIQEKKRSDARYAAARAIGKWLTKLPEEDRIVVIRHVLTEYGMEPVPIKPTN